MRAWKVCTRCDKTLPVDAFAKDASKSSGLKSQCKACDAARSAEYYTENQDKKREYYRANRRRILANNRRPPKKCRKCDRLALSARHRYCGPCGKEARRRPGRRYVRPELPTEVERKKGYDARHKALRNRLKPIVAEGKTPCARCGQLIKAGESWDLGHDDDDRSLYSGPEHAACNRATAGRKAMAASRARKKREAQSREW